MNTMQEPQEMTAPTEEEQRQALETSRFLAPLLGEAPDLQIVAGDGRATPLSPPARRLLYEILRQIAAGHAITVHPVPAELTTQQAADYLNVPRPTLVKIIESGELLSHKTGTHRRILLTDIAAYKHDLIAKRHAALDDLTALSQELGLY